MDHSELKAAREALGISQSEMAVRLTMHRNTYIKWESGFTKKLPPDLADRITRIAAGVAVNKVAIGEELVFITPGTHPQYYDKQGRHGWHANDRHPLGGAGYIKRRHLEIYERDGREALDAAMAEDGPAIPPAQPQRPLPTIAEAMGHYETTGQDDDITEKRFQAFCNNS